jgi:hypothetical protein
MKAIPGYPHYSVTEDGRVWSELKQIFLKEVDNGNGYKKVMLCDKLTKKAYLIHRIVALTYLDNIDKKPCVNHKNGIKSDNRVENLEWCTYSENNKHAFRTGLKWHSELQKSKVSKNAEKYSCKLVLDTATGIFYNSVVEASRYYNINIASIYSYLNGKVKNKTTLIYA